VFLSKIVSVTAESIFSLNNKRHLVSSAILIHSVETFCFHEHIFAFVGRFCFSMQKLMAEINSSNVCSVQIQINSEEFRWRHRKMREE